MASRFTRQSNTRDLPWMTAALACVLLLSFFWSYSTEKAAHQTLLNEYLELGLFDLEQEHYLDYQVHKVRVDFSESEASYERLLGALYSDERASFAWLVFEDKDFYHYLLSQGDKYMPSQNYEVWHQHRSLLEDKKHNQLPSHRFGFSPDQRDISRWLSAAFVDTSILDFVTNSFLILALMGFLERSRTAWFALASFILCSLTGNALLAILSQGQHQVFTGLNMSLFSLAGIAAWLFYKQQKTDLADTWRKRLALTFAFAGLALSAKALLEWWFASSLTIEWFAGLLSFVLLLIAYAFYDKLFKENLFSEFTPAAPEGEPSQALRTSLNQGFAELTAFKFEDALSRFKAIQADNPNDLISAKQCYLLTQANSASTDTQAATDRYAQALIAHNDVHHAKALLSDLRKQTSENNSVFPLNAYATLMRLFLNDNDFSRAERSFDLLRKHGDNPSLIQEAGYQLFWELRRSGLEQRAARYQQYQASTVLS